MASGEVIWLLVVPPRPVLSNEKRAGTRKRVEKKKQLMFDHVEAVVKRNVEKSLVLVYAKVVRECCETERKKKQNYFSSERYAFRTFFLKINK